MFANRVSETTTSSGTGDLTLAGASANCQSFSAAFTVGLRFSYFIVDSINNTWETGIGYLSDATTLVRETVLDNSLGSTSVLNLGVGSKTVICSFGEMSLHPSYGPAAANAWFRSGHLTYGEGAVRTLSADVIYYTPYLHLGVGGVDALGIKCGTAAGTKMRLGLYSNKFGRPHQLVVQTVNITPVSSAFISGSVGPVRLPPGWYWAAVLADGGASVGAASSTSVIQSVAGLNADSFNFVFKHLAKSITAGWTDLPAVADITAAAWIVNEATPQMIGRINV